MKTAMLLIISLLLAPGLVHAQLRATELSNPQPIGIPQGVDTAAAREAVKDALYGRNWSVFEEQDNLIVADLHVRRHWAQIGIEFSDRQIQIGYRNSENLHYRVDGNREIIHKNYLSWVDNLAVDIRRELGQAGRNSR